MNKLIEHVALSARVDRYEPTELNQTQSVSDMVDELTEVYPEGNRFDIRISDEATTNADREMLNVVLGNLIENAYKYAHAGSKILITASRENSIPSGTGLKSAAAAGNEALTLKISNAVGVFGAPDALHIFERYYRNPSSLIIPGMGIGLSLVQAAANKINATVKFEHLENTVTFTIRIPA
jgi:signal transduction histidine kinase